MHDPISRFVYLAFLMLLPGCAGGYNPEPPPASSLVAPTTYRAQIAANLRSTLRDPASVRDPLISQPFIHQMGAGERFVVCVRMNAKNGFGGFTGPVDSLAVFVGGELVSIGSPIAGECRKVEMTTFKEILKL